MTTLLQFCFQTHCLVYLAGFYCHCSVTKTELAAHTEALLTNLFMAMTKEGSHDNEYVMKG